MSETTPRPWSVGRPLPLMRRPHDVLIVGDRHYSHDEGDGDASACPCDCDGDREACDCPDGAGCHFTCTTVAHVLGNETAGGITRANAGLIVRAVNSFDDLLAACEAALAALGGHDPQDHAHESPLCGRLRAAIGKARDTAAADETAGAV